MCRCEDEKMICEKMIDRPPLLEEPFAQTLSGKINTGNEQPSCVNPNDMLMNKMKMHRPFAAESKLWPSGQSRPLNFRAKRSWR